MGGFGPARRFHTASTLSGHSPRPFSGAAIAVLLAVNVVRFPMLPGARFRVAVKARIVKLNPQRGAARGRQFSSGAALYGLV